MEGAVDMQSLVPCWVRVIISIGWVPVNDEVYILYALYVGAQVNKPHRLRVLYLTYKELF